MTAIRHIAHAVGSTDATIPAYGVAIRVGPHQLTADEPVTNGGSDSGPSPFGLLLGALAACTATTLRMYAARKGWDALPITVDVRYDISGGSQAAITRTITIPVSLTAEQRQHLAEVAGRTPVTLAVRGGTPITTTFQSRHNASQTLERG